MKSKWTIFPSNSTLQIAFTFNHSPKFLPKVWPQSLQRGKQQEARRTGILPIRICRETAVPCQRLCVPGGVHPGGHPHQEVHCASSGGAGGQPGLWTGHTAWGWSLDHCAEAQMNPEGRLGAGGLPFGLQPQCRWAATRGHDRCMCAGSETKILAGF